MHATNINEEKKVDDSYCPMKQNHTTCKQSINQTIEQTEAKLSELQDKPEARLGLGKCNKQAALEQ